MNCSVKKIQLSNLIEKANTGADAIKRAPIVGKDTGVRCLRIGDVSNDRPLEEWGFTDASDDVIKKFKLRKDDVMIARTGNTIGVVKYIDKDVTSVYNNGLIRLKVKNGCNARFVYYNLISQDFKDFIYGISAGTSTQPNMKIDHMLQYEVANYALTEQNRIVDVLSSIDNKIKLNNEMNKTLEEMAQALFKRWFVDFEFPNEDGEPYKSSAGEMVESELGMMPKGWKVYSVDEVCEINKSNYSNKENWDVMNYLDTANITKNKIDTIQQIDCINEKVPSRAKRKVKKDSIVYSTVRPNQLHYGIIKNPIENMIVSTGFVVLDCKIDFIKNDIIYYWLIQDNNTELLQSIAETSTSTYPSIKPSDIGTLKLALPYKEVIKNLEDKFDKINVLIDQLKTEEKQLIELRDSLLPKLMSGEIRVDDIEANL